MVKILIALQKNGKSDNKSHTKRMHTTTTMGGEAVCEMFQSRTLSNEIHETTNHQGKITRMPTKDHNRVNNPRRAGGAFRGAQGGGESLAKALDLGAVRDDPSHRSRWTTSCEVAQKAKVGNKNEEGLKSHNQDKYEPQHKPQNTEDMATEPAEIMERAIMHAAHS